MNIPRPCLFLRERHRNSTAQENFDVRILKFGIFQVELPPPLRKSWQQARTASTLVWQHINSNQFQKPHLHTLFYFMTAGQDKRFS